MRGVVSWLARLRASKHTELREHLFRVVVPGTKALDIDKWLIATDPQGALQQSRKAGSPEAWSVLRIIDQGETRVTEHERLSAEMAGLISLALDRRVDIPFEIALRMEGSDRVVFAPYAHIVDRTLLGPLPPDSLTPISELISRASTLSESDQDTLGDAISLLHASMLLFDREARSAYTLLIAGIEVLSREYGQPPEDWYAWEDYSSWEALFSQIALTSPQSERVRAQLLQNRHLRLKATFRSYGSERVPDTFWENTYDEWTYSVDITNGMPRDPPLRERRSIRDVLPPDRRGLSRALGESYDLRSRFVHRGHWLGPVDLVLPHDALVAWDRPLPFNVLRQLLAELLRTEIAARSSLSDLPDISVFRSPPLAAPV